ncbi:hypothetical protein BN9982_940007 [Mycobacterium tuberculosis]|nr:hypothetical protein BN9982_940007 [Mycobacterium tuberculosis]
MSLTRHLTRSGSSLSQSDMRGGSGANGDLARASAVAARTRRWRDRRGTVLEPVWRTNS